MSKDEAIEIFKAKLAKASRSPRTTTTYMWHLNSFFLRNNTSPSVFLEEAKKGKIDIAKMINETTDKMIEGKCTKSFVRTQVFAVKKFVKVVTGKGIDSFSQVALDEIGKDAKVKERPLDTQNIKDMLNSCRTRRDKALLMVAAVTGAREIELAGLLKSDIVEEAERVVVTVRDEIAKGRHGYVSFSTPEAHEILKDYLEERKRGGEEIGPESILFLPTDNNSSKIPHNMTPNAIGMIIREVMRRAGLVPPPVANRRVRHEVRPHLLRKFTRTAFLKAEIPEEVAEKLLGHGVEELSQVYTPMSVDELWGYYKKAIPLLAIEKQLDLSPQMGELTEENKKLQKRLEEMEGEGKGMRERIQRIEDFTKRFMGQSPEQMEEMYDWIWHQREESKKKGEKGAPLEVQLKVLGLEKEDV